MTEANAEAVIAATGLTPPDVQNAVDYIGEAGEEPGATLRLSEQDRVLTLVSPGCPE